MGKTGFQILLGWTSSDIEAYTPIFIFILLLLVASLERPSTDEAGVRTPLAGLLCAGHQHASRTRALPHWALRRAQIGPVTSKASVGDSRALSRRFRNRYLE